MKKLLTGILIMMVVVLAACSASPTETAQITQASAVTEAATVAAAAATTDGTLNANYDSAVSVEQQLLFGILNLDGTDQQIGKEQAASLVSLLTNLQSLSMQNTPAQGAADGAQTDTSTQQPPEQNSDNQAQVDALVQQMEAVMTTDQLKAISAMQITRDSAAMIMEAKGIMTNSGAPQGSMGAPQGNGDANGAPAQGDASQGTPPVMNGTPDVSGQGGQGQPGQGQPGGNGQMGGSMIQPEVLSAVIQYVANIAGVEVPTVVPGQ